MRRTIVAVILILGLLLVPSVASAAPGVQVVDKTGDGVWIDSNTWQVQMFPGETKSTTLTLYNSASISLDVEVNITPNSQDNDNLVFELNQTSFTMSDKSYDNVILTVRANGSVTPGMYSATFEIKSEVPSPSPSPASFVVSDLNVEQSPLVKKNIFLGVTGENVTITANVANKGGQGGTHVVELKLNGETVDTAMVILDTGQSQQISFTLFGMDYGQYQVEVAGLSGEFTVSRTITWWLIIVIVAAIGLITWVAIWGRRKRGDQKWSEQRQLNTKKESEPMSYTPSNRDGNEGAK